MKPNNRKKPVILFLSVMILLASVGGILLLCQKKDDRSKTPSTPAKSGDIVFCTPDYTEDIFADSAYLSLDRGITFEYGSESYYCETEAQCRSLGGDALFFFRLFDTIIRGDYTHIPSFLHPDCPNGTLPDRFTMQKLYRISVTRIDTLPTEDDSIQNFCYAVSYFIKDNNGTFRCDIGSNMAKVQIFTIEESHLGESYLIRSIESSGTA